jgi:hypothetical protein
MAKNGWGKFKKDAQNSPNPILWKISHSRLNSVLSVSLAIEMKTFYSQS